MIRLYDRDETDFTHNETVLKDAIKSETEVVANGMYENVLEYPRNEFAKQLTEGKVIKVPTANGEQLFRIYKPVKNLNTYTIYSRHIFYDLLTNFIEDIRPTKKGGDGAIKDILRAAQIDQGFRAFSDITRTGSATYIRKNPVEALLGAKNSFINVWGGELVRDNHMINIYARGGEDRGYEVRLGKNLTGVEVETDESNVYTRIYPTVVIDEQTVTTLPEKYVDSPIIDNYEYPKIIEERIDLTDEQKELPIEDIYTLMRDHCSDLFEQGVDKPEVNFKIDFVELSKTEQYKDLKILEKLDLYDTVLAYIPELDINVKAKVIKTKYDSIRKRYLNMELGSFKANGASQAKNTINRIDKEVGEASSYLEQSFKEAQDKITGNLGGHVITRLNAEGKPYELLVMDTEDIQTAKNVIRLNQQGVGFSNQGYNGPFGVGITIDGVLNAEIIDVIALTAESIVGGNLELTKGLKITNDGVPVLSIDAATGKVKLDIAGIPTKEEMETAIDNNTSYEDKTEILSGTDIYTDKADDSVVHVEIDGKSYQDGTPTPDAPIPIESLNNFDIISQKATVNGESAVDGIEVGGRNLIVGYNGGLSNVRLYRASGTSEIIEDEKSPTGKVRKIKINAMSSTRDVFYITLADMLGSRVSKDVEYTVSFLAKASQDVRLKLKQHNQMTSRKDFDGYISTEYSLVSFTAKPTVDSDEAGNYNSHFEFPNSIPSGQEIYIQPIKVEKGNKATDRTPAPEDIPYDTKQDGVYKTNILLSEPLRSVGDVHDKLYRNADGLWEVERNVEVLGTEDGSLPINEEYGVLNPPTTEPLAEKDQIKLNNIASFKGDNYVYTIVENDNLKPTLHATFKSEAWYNNFKTKKALENKTDQTETDEIRTDLTEIETSKAEKEELSILEQAVLDYASDLTTSNENLDAAQAAIEDLLNRAVGIEANLGELAIKTSFIDTTITQDKNGLFVGDKSGSSGILISQKTGISFRDGGKLVAQITNGMLRIDRGVFVKSLTVGEHKLETVSPGNTVISWVPTEGGE